MKMDHPRARGICGVLLTLATLAGCASVASATSARLVALNHDLGLIPDESDAPVYPSLASLSPSALWAGTGFSGVSAGNDRRMAGLFWIPGEPANAFGTVALGTRSHLGIVLRGGNHRTDRGTIWRPGVVAAFGWGAYRGDWRSETSVEASWLRVRQTFGDVRLHADGVLGRFRGPIVSYAVRQRVQLWGDRRVAFIVSGHRSRTDLTTVAEGPALGASSGESFRTVTNVSDDGGIAAASRIDLGGGTMLWIGGGYRNARNHVAETGAGAPWGLNTGSSIDPRWPQGPRVWPYPYPSSAGVLDVEWLVHETTLPSVSLEYAWRERWTARAGFAARLQQWRRKAIYPSGYPPNIVELPAESSSQVGGTAAVGLSYTAGRLTVDAAYQAGGGNLAAASARFDF